MQTQLLVIFGFIKIMSSYLTFYLVPKAEDSKPLALMSYSRSSDIYQYFDDTIHPAYIGMGDETQYTELTVAMVDEVLEDLKNDISKARKRVAEYEKHAAGNSEIIEDILGQKEWIEDLEWALHKIEFIRDIVYEASCGWNEYNKVLCNVG